MAAIRNSGVSVFEGVVKCAINGMYCRDYALCPHYSVSPHFRGVRREGFHCRTTSATRVTSVTRATCATRVTSATRATSATRVTCATTATTDHVGYTAGPSMNFAHALINSDHTHH